MRRTTRNSLLRVSSFFALLFFIIRLTRTSEPTKIFSWKTIKYKSRNPVPFAHGVCPGLSKSDKPALVISRVSTDSSAWLESLEEKYTLCPYTVDAISPSSTTLQVPQNRGHEGMSYLTFIIDNYSNLPEHMVFVHGSRFAWHNDHEKYDNLKLLEDLRIEMAVAAHGYHNLRCDWSLSTCPMDSKPQAGLETKVQAKLVPYDARAVSDAALSGALASIFGDDGGKLGRHDGVLRSQCCAQFVVTRENVLTHGKEEFVQLRQWLLDGSKGVKGGRRKDAAPKDDKVAGRILSYIWHILFMDEGGEGNWVDLERMNSLACPTAADCYCKLYGRCGLDGCHSPGRCRGQYSLPSNLRLPEDWEEMYG